MVIGGYDDGRMDYINLTPGVVQVVQHELGPKATGHCVLNYKPNNLLETAPYTDSIISGKSQSVGLVYIPACSIIARLTCDPTIFTELSAFDGFSCRFKSCAA